MPTSDKENRGDATPRSKKRNFLKSSKSKTMGAFSLPGSPTPTRPGSAGGGKKGQPPEIRYTKAVNLLFEARKIAKELEEKKKNGEELFRNKLRGSGRGLSRPSTPKSGIDHLGHLGIDGISGYGRGAGKPAPYLSLVDPTLSPGRSARSKALQAMSRRCEECGRCLSSGYFSEHRGQSYCNVPCYSMLFSSLSGLYERNDRISDGSKTDLTEDQEKFRNTLVPRLRIYNTYYADKPSQISCTESEGNLILEGILKVYWGLKKPVTLIAADTSYWRNFQPENGSDTIKRRSSIGAENGEDQVDSKRQRNQSNVRRSKSNIGPKRTRYRGSKKESSFDKDKDTTTTSMITTKTMTRTSSNSSSRSSANSTAKSTSGKVEKTTFVPPYGTPTTLRLTNQLNTLEVVSMLLQKFQISDPPENFSLFTVYESGGLKRLKPEGSPLVVRLNLGPCEDVSKIFIMETADRKDITHEVAQYIQFTNHELAMFLEKFKDEEEREVQKIKERYIEYRQKLDSRIAELDKHLRVTSV